MLMLTFKKNNEKHNERISLVANELPEEAEMMYQQLLERPQHCEGSIIAQKGASGHKSQLSSPAHHFDLLLKAAMCSSQSHPTRLALQH